MLFFLHLILLKNMSYRIMRLIVMFDLPTETKEDLRIYRRFRKTIIENGFLMLQYSVYVRICTNQDAADSIVKKINEKKPSRGHVRCLLITEKQYERTKLLIGEKLEHEKTITTSRFLIF